MEDKVFFGQFHVKNPKYKPTNGPRVTKACINCRKAHACCSHERPCERCVKLGLESTCTDAVSKKRGPKRKKTTATTIPTEHIVYESGSNSDAAAGASASAASSGKVVQTKSFHGQENQRNQYQREEESLSFQSQQQQQQQSQQSQQQHISEQYTATFRMKSGSLLRTGNQQQSCTEQQSPTPILETKQHEPLISLAHDTQTTPMDTESSSESENSSFVPLSWSCSNVSSFETQRNRIHQQTPHLALHRSLEQTSFTTQEKNALEELAKSDKGPWAAVLWKQDGVSLYFHEQNGNGLKNHEDNTEKENRHSSSEINSDESVPNFTDVEEIDTDDFQQRNFKVFDIGDLGEQTQRLSLFVNHFTPQTGYVFFNNNHSVTDCNDTFARAFGVSRNRILNQSWFKLVHPSYQPIARQKYDMLTQNVSQFPKDENGGILIKVGRGIAQGRHRIFEYWHSVYVIYDEQTDTWIGYSTIYLS